MGGVYQFGNSDLDTRIEYEGTYGQPLYVTEAKAGASVGANVWRIKKMELDSSGRIISTRFANGNADFAFNWTDRATYTYIVV